MMRRMMIVALCLFGATTMGCSAVSSVLGSADQALVSAGLAEEAEERSVSMETLGLSLNNSQAQALNPFEEQSVSYTVTGLNEVDSFTEASANVYGSVLVLQNIVSEGTSMIQNPSYNTAGFNDARSLLSVGQTISTTVSQEIPALITTGQDLATNIAKPRSRQPHCSCPRATTEVQTALGRLNDSQSMVRGIATDLTSLMSQLTK